MNTIIDQNIVNVIHANLPYVFGAKSQYKIIISISKQLTKLNVSADSIIINKLDIHTDKGSFMLNEIIADGDKNRKHNRNIIQKIK